MIGFNLIDEDKAVLDKIAENLDNNNILLARTRIANHPFAAIFTQEYSRTLFDFEELQHV